MKNFFTLLQDKKFLFYLIVILAIIIWNFFSGSRLFAVVFLIILCSVIALNLYKTA